MLHILIGYPRPGQRGAAKVLAAGDVKTEIEAVRLADKTCASFMTVSGVNGVRKSNPNFDPEAITVEQAKSNHLKLLTEQIEEQQTKIEEQQKLIEPLQADLAKHVPDPVAPPADELPPSHEDSHPRKKK